ncbi:MAG: phosphoglucosamine mutase [Candidatus Bipolaricaulota bacterium]|nr:MAG: phosphoglucosamine mutase [Candidatus Bipolaricaulota bacterium]
MEPVTPWKTLFGTDGIRGRANVELTPELALAVGRAAARVVLPRGGRVVIGRDTRVSGSMLEAALIAGLTACGAEVLVAGIVPTPAIAYLIRDERAALGVVVSASHNPPEDNGIKLFDRWGMKLPERLEEAIAEEIKRAPRSDDLAVGSSRPLDAAASRYAAFLTGAMEIEDVDLTGMTIVLDCAHGATGGIAPRVLEHFNARVIGLHVEPDGGRINDRCGVLDLGPLREAVAEHGADLGIAFDGDGDRILVVTSEGDTIDGDLILGIAALHLHRAGRLDPARIVATVLSNLGLERTLGSAGVAMERTPVGDRHVAEAMRRGGMKLGGEKSGHIIFGDHSPTGDGILTAVKLVEIAHETGRALGDLAADVRLLPQEQSALPVADPGVFLGREDVQRCIDRARASLAADGRLLVRASGTQSLIRVMVEAETEARCAETHREVSDCLAAIAAQSAPEGDVDSRVGSSNG